MTGFGDARREHDQLGVAVEVRTVNNRYLKVSTRSPEALSRFEADIERMVRERVARGTVNLTLRVRRLAGAARYRLNVDVVTSYWRELHRIAETLHVAAPHDLSALLQLPGAVEEADDEAEADLWPLTQEALAEAFDRLSEFRRAEGASMAEELRANCDSVEAELDKVAGLAPAVVEEYRDRLLERVRELLAAHDVQVDASDVIRDVSLFAERADVNEEVTRLRSHLGQFRNFLDSDASMGRKLEFLSQEMFREINTIGSKANNVEIAHAVVEMKSAVEKIREIVQNVE